MTRTTLDIDTEVLRELERRQRASGKTLDALVSELLASALEKTRSDVPAAFAWTSRNMGALVTMDDKEAVRRAMESR